MCILMLLKMANTRIKLTKGCPQMVTLIEMHCFYNPLSRTYNNMLVISSSGKSGLSVRVWNRLKIGGGNTLTIVPRDQRGTHFHRRNRTSLGRRTSKITSWPSVTHFLFYETRRRNIFMVTTRLNNFIETRALAD